MLVILAYLYTEWIKGKPSEAHAIRNGCGTGLEQKFQAEVLSRFSSSKKGTQGISVNSYLKFFEISGQP